MSEAGSKTVLSPYTVDRCDQVRAADVVVGIPSFRSAKTISRVVDAAGKGMVKYFPELRPVIVNADGGSEDRTREVVLDTPVPRGVEKIVTPYKGPAGKGSAFKTIFEVADRLKAQILIVVDSDLRSITPEWIYLLGDPVYRMSFGFVTPHYLRYKYDGTITNAIAYPLTRALYGQMVRQPIGGDFGMTGALAKIFSHQDFLDDPLVSKFGIDIWMTTTAIAEGFRLCQAAMGVKLHDPKDPSSDLGPMFHQVVGTIFGLMRRYEIKWKASRGSQPVDLFGQPSEQEPERFEVDVSGLARLFREGVREHGEVLEQVVAPDQLARVRAEAERGEEVVAFTPDLWARIVYDFGIAHSLGAASPSQVVEAMLPLYYGWTASFVFETEHMNAREAEEAVEHLGDTFEREKPYLIERWDAARRGMRGDERGAQAEGCKEESAAG